MTGCDMVRTRLVSQQITGSRFSKPGEVVQWMGSVQAQDYPAALWGVGLRTPAATRDSIERAIAKKQIVRTWPMRGTLHFVAPNDVRWMLRYLTPRIVSRASMRFRQLHLDEATFARSRTILAKILRGGKQLARDSIYALLERNRVSCRGQRGIHILWKLSQEGLVCFGPREGKQPTFVLLDEWVPSAKIPPRDVALATLAKRYFTSHGPATLKDFAWWSGLAAADARSALEEVKGTFASEDIAGQTCWFQEKIAARPVTEQSVCLLPAFDEFLVAYKDRSAAIDAPHARQAHPGGGILRPTVLIDGKIIGTWKRTVEKDVVVIQLSTFITLSKPQRVDVEGSAERYGRFWGTRVAIKTRTERK